MMRYSIAVSFVPSVFHRCFRISASACSSQACMSISRTNG